MTVPFAPTHTVPEGGLEVWSEPDPTVPSIARLDARVPVAVTERRGDWAHVACDNGFTGWLGAATLQPVAASLVGAATAPAAPAVLPGMPPAGYYARLYETAERGPTASPAALALAEGATVEAKPASITAIGVGAFLTIVGCFLPWFTFGEVGTTGYEVPLQFIFLKSSIAAAGSVDASTGPTVGLACLLAALVGVVCSRRASADKFRRLLGWLIVLLPTMTVGQVQLLLNDLAGAFGRPSLLSSLGIGLGATLIGGLVLALAPRATKAPDTGPGISAEVGP